MLQIHVKKAQNGQKWTKSDFKAIFIRFKMYLMLIFLKKQHHSYLKFAPVDIQFLTSVYLDAHSGKKSNMHYFNYLDD